MKKTLDISFGKKKTLANAVAIFAFALSSMLTTQAFVSISLTGNTEYEGWSDLTATNHPTLPNFFSFTTPWPDAIAPNETGSAGNATFGKDSGGGYPASTSIYNFTVPGTYSIANTSPIADLETVIFQADLGGDLSTFFATPVLIYNGGSQNLTADYYSLTAGQFITSNPNDPEAGTFPTSNHAFQWDLSDVLDPITSYTIVWTTVDHSTNFGMQLDSGNVFSQQVFSAVPEPSTYAVIVGLLALGACHLKRRKVR